MRVVLISTYDLGRQPFSLASASAWLREAGAQVQCLDVAVEALDIDTLQRADLVAISLPMHTATRLGANLLRKIRQINPQAHICFFGLYAPINESYLRKLGADSILGGEVETSLVSLLNRLGKKNISTNDSVQQEPVISLARQSFLVPDRSSLPGLDKYAKLQVAPDEHRLVGYTEATRGCKHLCRHCPIVPVYGGAFRVVDREVVLADIRQQVAAGAEHITFGDPDFFNGPTHGVAIARRLNEEFPRITYDVTIKVEHLLRHSRHLQTLRDTGCLFVTCAVESLDDEVLFYFDKRHTRQDFLEVVDIFRAIGLRINPTFVTFTPWTTLHSYVELLDVLAEQDLVDAVSPIQYAIRLLVTASSKLLELEAMREIIGDFDEEKLAYEWAHPDPRVDQLFERVMAVVQEGASHGKPRREIFNQVSKLAHDVHENSINLKPNASVPVVTLPGTFVPHLTEPWYC